MRTSALAICALTFGWGCIGPEDGPTTGPGELLIVATDPLLRCAERIAATHDDHDTVIMTMPEIMNPEAGAELVDRLIDDFVSNRDATGIMLVGIHQILPGHEVTMPNLDETTWADRPYAELADGRTVPTGRIPVADDEECAEYLQRPTSNADPDRNVIVFFGNEPEISYAELHHAEYARELGFEPVVLVSPDTDELAAAFADGDVLAAFYYGHAWYYANFPLDADNAVDILPPGILYFSGGCGFGQPGPDDTSVAETIVNRLGGTAIGASDFGGYGYKYQFVQEVLRRLGSAETVGELQLEALEGYREVELPPDRVDTLEDRLVLYGDPTTPLF